ncbi:MAG TPA: VWA domain-containing protein [Vicinamibacterales bacterium]|nr:VWA domain-containing protein [Vicinamibacterales bacterium]
MRTASVVCLLACAVLAGGAQQAPPAQQTPPPQGQPPAQPPTSPQQPVFRGEVDVIRLDVSVLDKDRRPVRGLTVDDFTVTEDGKPQRLVAVSEIDMAENDPAPSAWMRHVPRDVAANDLSDQVGDGRLVAIVMDDWNIPFDDLDIIMAARAVGRYVIDQLGPSDVAAVIFPQQAGKTQDFTDDRAKLIEAVDKFDPPEVRWIPATPMGPGPGGGDMPQRFSPALMRSQCQRAQPTIPVLDTVASRLATVPNRRKTVFFVSVGLPIDFVATRGCAGELASIMQDVFRKAQRGNINIYGIDPAGYRGYENYLTNPIRRAGRPAERVMPAGAAQRAARTRREFLQIAAEHTGARAIVNTDAFEPDIDQIFEEAGSYYLVGYQTSNGRPDGKFRKVDVKVKRPGMTVRSRSGYYAPREGTLATAEQRATPATSDLGLVGMYSPAGLVLRAAAAPIARSAATGKHTDVALVLTVRLPAVRGAISETLTVVRTLYDAEGRAGPPVQEKVNLTLQSTTGDELRYDVYQRLSLAPGRHTVRLNATSAALDRSGTVYADIEVPDFTRPVVTASSIVLGTRTDPPVARTDVLASILPVTPTSARDFSPSDTVIAFLRVFQGGATPIAPVTVTTRILDIDDKPLLDVSGTIAPEGFDATRGAPFEILLPLATLSHGPHLLSITVATPGSSNVRRDLVFRVR